jgi:hypothetical protein
MITDGTFICSLCGEWLAGCSLCGEAPLKDMRPYYKQLKEDENELIMQERSIRRAADKRQGW